MRAAVVVVGDLGRSPRMQYHARALAASGADVDFIGYEGAPLPTFITGDPRIHVHTLSEPGLRYRRAGEWDATYAFLAAVDALRLTVRLYRLLMRLAKPDLLLVQNPPALPTLAVARAVARVRGARLVVDWHNLGYT